mgnify:CR=1 FL=1
MQTNSEILTQQITDLQQQRNRALDSEARERCRKIFGEVPNDYSSGTEETFAAVARVYCRRAHGYRGDRLEDHEWIALWHKYEKKASLDELLSDTEAYVSGGCGIAG